MVLWRHECSRYASSSRIGYHPNHPSSSHPSSRPSSAATTLRPLSAGRAPLQSKHPQQQRASSAVPRQSLPLGEEPGAGGARDEDARILGAGSGLSRGNGSERVGRGSSRTRPRSAIPRLGVDTEDGADNIAARIDRRPARGNSASAARSEDGADGGEGASIGRRRVRKDGHSSAARTRGGRSASARSRSPIDRHKGSNREREGEGGGDETYEDIYEDLDDEDDGELDNRISIMESRFSTVGRERPARAGDGGGGATVVDGLVDAQRQRQRQRLSGPQQTVVPAAPRSAATQRPPRHEQQQASTRSRTTRRQLVSSARTDGSGMEVANGTTPSSNAIQDAQPPRIVRSRPTSAPIDGSFGHRQYQRGISGAGVYDPMVPLHARRLRLQMSSSARARAESRSAEGREQDAEGGTGEGNLQQQQRKRPVRDVSGDQK